MIGRVLLIAAGLVAGGAAMVAAALIAGAAAYERDEAASGNEYRDRWS